MTSNIKLGNLSWGWRIGALYGGFVTLMIFLVVKSSQQRFDLVSKDYYQQEISYQKVLDASKNQAALSAAMDVHANSVNVIIDLPAELKGKTVTGSVQFYSPVDAKWDRVVKLDIIDGKAMIPRNTLANIRYTMKITCSADGKNYYQESEINLY